MRVEEFWKSRRSLRSSGLRLLICIITPLVGAHGVNPTGTHCDLAAHQTKCEVMPLIEGVSIASIAPEKHNFFALIESLLVFIGNGPSDIDVKAGVSECDTWSTSLCALEIIERHDFWDIYFCVRVDSEIIGRGLPIVPQLGMGNERISTFFERVYLVLNCAGLRRRVVAARNFLLRP